MPKPRKPKKRRVTPKVRRTFWIQLCYSDRDDEWLESFGNYDSTLARAGKLLYTRNADYALVLRPQVRHGAIANQGDILADLQREAVPGAKILQVVLRTNP